MVKSIVIAGVGGQGTLLTSKILATAAGARGLFVRTSETIGMAQRGGSVSSHLRIDARQVSPIIPCAHGDILLGFELAEAVRMIPKLKAEAKCVVNTDRIIPTTPSTAAPVPAACPSPIPPNSATLALRRSSRWERAFTSESNTSPCSRKSFPKLFLLKARR